MHYLETNMLRLLPSLADLNMYHNHCPGYMHFLSVFHHDVYTTGVSSEVAVDVIDEIAPLPHHLSEDGSTIVSAHSNTHTVTSSFPILDSSLLKVSCSLSHNVVFWYHTHVHVYYIRMYTCTHLLY